MYDIHFTYNTKFWPGGGHTRIFTSNKPERFTFPMVFCRSHSMQNNMAFIMRHCKQKSVIWIWKYHYFKWNARLHSNRFSYFLHNISSFQNLKRICRIKCENLTKIQKSPKCVLPPGIGRFIDAVRKPISHLANHCSALYLMYINKIPVVCFYYSCQCNGRGK